MTVAKPCAECFSGPSGLEGHGQLVMQVPVTGQPNPHIGFRCTLCRTEWSRRYEGGGVFSWRMDISSN